MKGIKLFAAACAICLICGCTEKGYRTIRGYAQGGTYSVTFRIDGSKLTEAELAGGIDSILTAVDTTLSGYNKASQLSRFNNAEDVELSPMFKEILGISEAMREETGGAFDAAAAPLFDIWGFGFTSDSMPTEEEIAAAKERCREGRTLNFNAIAQGYTADLVAGYLRSAGIHDFLVDIGELCGEGLNPSGKGWSIGIDTPEDGNNTPGASISGVWHSDGGAYGVVTSGNYRKFYMRDGRKYSHTIDPRTGMPVEHSLLSATVIAENATRADALATFFMVIGTEEASAWVDSHPGVEACLIAADTTWVSAGFHK